MSCLKLTGGTGLRLAASVRPWLSWVAAAVSCERGSLFTAVPLWSPPQATSPTGSTMLKVVDKQRRMRTSPSGISRRLRIGEGVVKIRARWDERKAVADAGSRRLPPRVYWRPTRPSFTCRESYGRFSLLHRTAPSGPGDGARVLAYPHRSCCPRARPDLRFSLGKHQGDG